MHVSLFVGVLQCFTGYPRLQADKQFPVGGGFHDIPHFTFSGVIIVGMGSGVIVAGMHLHRQIVVGVNNLYQQGKGAAFFHCCRNPHT
jgi:hypothetical protein